MHALVTTAAPSTNPTHTHTPPFRSYLHLVGCFQVSKVAIQALAARCVRSPSRTLRCSQLTHSAGVGSSTWVKTNRSQSIPVRHRRTLTPIFIGRSGFVRRLEDLSLAGCVRLHEAAFINLAHNLGCLRNLNLAGTAQLASPNQTAPLARISLVPLFTCPPPFAQAVPRQ
jgi:hypothetical protein